jgi:serine/threonine-protein kinase RsbW
VRCLGKIDRMPIREPPHIRLHLGNRSENVALVRTMLAGIAEAIDLPHESLADVKTAVTEACNNVVLHAYQGGPGPLEVDVQIAEGALQVVVRDEGIGIQDKAATVDEGALTDDALTLSEIDDGSLKLGLPVIQALTDRIDFHRLVDGTEVCMEFATPRAPPFDVSQSNDFAPLLTKRTSTEPSPVKLPLIESPLAEQSLEEFLRVEDSELSTAATITITHDRLARAVLPRLVCALAARANFSTDRLSDAQLLADVIAAQAFQAILGSHLGVGIALEPRRVELRIGPLPAIGVDEVPPDSMLGGLSPVLETLADDHSLKPVGPASLLALQLIDRHRPVTGSDGAPG